MDPQTLSGFADEIEKIAFDRDKAKHTAKVVGGVLGGAALGFGGLLATKPALRAHVKAMVKSIGKDRRAAENARALPKGAILQAKAIAKSLREQGLDPATMRIGISGTGGTGKSTLAKALADELGMKTRAMKGFMPGNPQGRKLTAALKDAKLPGGIIADQTHLFNQVDPDKFDAIIRMHKPIDRIEKQMIARGRGAGQLEKYDYKKLDKSIHIGFSTTKGPTQNFGGGVTMKVRPKDGFRADELLDKKIKARGMDPAGMDRAQKVLAAAHGETGKGGVNSYLRTGNIAGSMSAVAGAGAAGGYAAHRVSKKDE